MGLPSPLAGRLVNDDASCEAVFAAGGFHMTLIFVGCHADVLQADTVGGRVFLSGKQARSG